MLLLGNWDFRLDLIMSDRPSFSDRNPSQDPSETKLDQESNQRSDRKGKCDESPCSDIQITRYDSSR